ncbi:uncharacterized protein LOC136032411 [Artemia franciscana]|uniref:uncharacterized protein LOC136032411 n=1 Tax=Artemia franciscana TaxID=6661 RepID=UPI0032DB43F8
MAYTPVQVHIPVGINGLDQRRDSSSSPGSYLSCVSPGQASSISGRSSNGTAASSPQFFNPADFKPLRRPKTTGEEDNKVTTANRTMNYAEEIQLLKQKIDDMGKEKTDLLMDVFESNSVCHEQCLQQKLDQHLCDEQHGLQPARSCADLNFTLKMLVEDSKEWNKKLYILFFDLEKVFDLVD